MTQAQCSQSAQGDLTRRARCCEGGKSPTHLCVAFSSRRGGGPASSRAAQSDPVSLVLSLPARRQPRHRGERGGVLDGRSAAHHRSTCPDTHCVAQPGRRSRRCLVDDAAASPCSDAPCLRRPPRPARRGRGQIRLAVELAPANVVWALRAAGGGPLLAAGACFRPSANGPAILARQRRCWHWQLPGISARAGDDGGCRACFGAATVTQTWAPQSTG